MADRINSFPDSILFHILSFLPTKQVVATSLLSKRWNPLWRSVVSFDFDYEDFNMLNNEKTYFHFSHSVYSFLLCRDLDQSFHRFRLRSGFFYYCFSIMTWIKAAMRSIRLEQLDLDLNWSIELPSMVFSCKTLVVLKLTELVVKDISFVDLPLLKILHLNSIVFSSVHHSQLLSGSPNLEDLKVKRLDVSTEGKFSWMPKLVRADIQSNLVPLEVVKNVEVLFIDSIYQLNMVYFQNLVQLELTYLQSSKDWVDVLELLKHSPKLQTLAIGIHKLSFDLLAEGHEGAVLPYPQIVPTCISLHLKTCCLKNYKDTVDEFQFARYVMQNAKYLRTMKICTDSDADNALGKRLDMMRDLSSCLKSSNSCTLLFE